MIHVSRNKSHTTEGTNTMRDWRSEANCTGTSPDVFFPADDFSHPEMTELQRTAHNSENLLRARLICSGCPVQTACLTYAEAEDQEHGVYAGMTPVQRRDLFRRSVARVQAGRRAPVTWRHHSKGIGIVRDFSYGSPLAAVAAKYRTTPRTVVREVSGVIAHRKGKVAVAL